MLNNKITENTLYHAGNYQVSIGNPKTEVGIISKSSGDWVQIKHIRKGGLLARVKRKFKSYLNSNNTMHFSHMGKEQVILLIEMLKKG